MKVTPCGLGGGCQNFWRMLWTLLQGRGLKHEGSSFFSKSDTSLPSYTTSQNFWGMLRTLLQGRGLKHEGSSFFSKSDTSLPSYTMSQNCHGTKLFTRPTYENRRLHKFCKDSVVSCDFCFIFYISFDWSLYWFNKFNMRTVLNIIPYCINATLIFCGGFYDSQKKRAQRQPCPVPINILQNNPTFSIPRYYVQIVYQIFFEISKQRSVFSST